MSVRFVIGRAGAGKTQHCFRAIVEAMRDDPLGPPIFWILPKQATFSAERQLTCASGLAGFCRCRVVSFDQLAREILAECRGAAVPEITALGRQMLLGHLLRKLQPELRFFKDVARQPGLASRLDSTFAEFDRCGKDAADLAALLVELQSTAADDVEAKLLIDKLSDFHLLYGAYRDFLGQDRVDPHRRLDQVFACLHESKQFRGASIYVDAFLEFADTERRTLAKLAGVCERMVVTLLCDPTSRVINDPRQSPDRFSLFHRLEHAYGRLRQTFAEAAVDVEPSLMLDQTLRIANGSLVEIEKQLFSGPIMPRQDVQGVELIEAPDRRAEVAACARRIKALAQSGLRLRDIAVLVRSLDDYHDLIDAAFREHGIPFFADRRRTAAHHPLLQFTRASLAIARGNCPSDAVTTLIKSGLAQLSLDQADELENYVLLHRIRGAAWSAREPWTYGRTIRKHEDDEATPIEQAHAARMDALRRLLVDRLSPLIRLMSKPRTVREIAEGIFDLFARFEITGTIAHWIDESTDPEQRGEHEQVWAELVELFDQMVDLLGDQTIDLEDFVVILESGLEQFDLALTPATVDQVLVGQVDRTRTTAPDTVFLLGLSDGQFPHVAREDSVLSDSERRALQKRNLDVEPDSERRLLDENLFGYFGFTRATARLFVTRAIADEQARPLAPSIFWQRLRELFPALEPTIESREADAPADSIATPRQLVTSLMRWARESAEISAQQTAPWPALYDWLCRFQSTPDTDPIGVMRFRAWNALSYVNQARLSPEIAGKLFASPLRASVTRIECFATCPFKHFAQFGLKLLPREDDDVTAMDLGNVYHQVLERLVTECLRQRKDWCKLEPSLTREMISSYANEVGKTLRGELLLSSARNQYILKRIEKTLEQIVQTQREVLSRGSFRPKFVELGFGLEGGKLPAYALTTPHGNTVELRGKIDRVDMLGDEVTFAVIDYKLSGRALDLYRVYHGISLQLLTYMLVLQHGGQELTGKKLTPAAAFYAQLLRGLEQVDHPDEAADPEDPAFPLRIKPRGIFNKDYLGAIDASLKTGTSEVIAAQIKLDGEIGRRDSSDVAMPDEFSALLKYVERRIGELADLLIEGDIGISPYRIKQQSPCSICDFRAICRFDVTINHYNILPAMKRGEVLDLVTKGKRDGQ